MKIVRLLSIQYKLSLAESIYACQPSQTTYSSLIETFRKERLLSPNYFPEAMQAYGDQVFDFVIDFPPLLSFWSVARDLKEALLRFIKEKKADILYFEKAAIELTPKSVKQSLKQAYPSLKFAGYWGAELKKKDPSSLFAFMDFLFSIDEHLTEILARHCPKVSMLRSHFDGKEAPFTPFSQRTIPVSFLGTSGYGFADHQKRFFFLRQLCRKIPITLHCDEPPRDRKTERHWKIAKILSRCPQSLLAWGHRKAPVQKRAFQKALRIKEGKLPYLPCYQYRPLKEEFPSQVNPALFGSAYEKRIQDTQITLNIHVDHPLLYGNMRTYEATGLGSLLLTDRPEQMQKLFTLDKEIVGYHTLQEALEKIEDLLKNPDKAEEIARRGQKKTLQEYTIFQKARIIHQTLQQLIDNELL